MNKTPINTAVELLTFKGVAEACRVQPPSVFKWAKNGRLPRTEITGETDYASAIERATAGAVSADALREMTRQAWRNNKRQAA